MLVQNRLRKIKTIVVALCKTINSSVVINTTTQSKLNTDSCVERLQKELNAKGFGPLDIEGILRQLTLSACPVIR